MQGVLAENKVPIDLALVLMLVGIHWLSIRNSVVAQSDGWRLRIAVLLLVSYCRLTVYSMS